MHIRILLIILFCWPTLHVIAQICSGRIITTQGNPLPGAIIKISKNDTVLHYKLANSNGEFKLQLPLHNPELYVLEISFLGYATKIWKNNPYTCRDLSIVTLEDASNQLEEITLKAAKAVTIKGDTTQFNAIYFKQMTDRTLEQLLLRLPGVEIRNGKVYYNGQTIQKILLEGDDLTGRNYQNILTSLGAEGVLDIEIIKNYINRNSLIDGFNNNKEMVMNIHFKKNFLGNFTGSFLVGVTQNIRNYSVEMNPLLLTKKIKAVSGLQGNSIGKTSYYESNYQIPENDVNENNAFMQIQGNAMQNLLFENNFTSDNGLPTERLTFNKTQKLTSDLLLTHNNTSKTRVNLSMSQNNGTQNIQQQITALSNGIFFPLSQQTQENILKQNFINLYTHTRFNVSSKQQVDIQLNSQFVTGKHEINSILSPDTNITFFNKYQLGYNSILIKYSFANNAKTVLVSSELNASTAKQFLKAFITPSFLIQDLISDSIKDIYNQKTIWQTKALDIGTNIFYKPNKNITFTGKLDCIYNFQPIQTDGFSDSANQTINYNLGTNKTNLQTIIPQINGTIKWAKTRNFSLEIGTQILHIMQRTPHLQKANTTLQQYLYISKKIKKSYTLSLNIRQSLINSNADNLLKNGWLEGIQTLRFGTDAFYESIKTNGNLLLTLMPQKLKWVGYINTGFNRSQNGVVSGFTASPFLTTIRDSLLNNITHYNFLITEIIHNKNNFKNRISLQLKLATGNTNFIQKNRLWQRTFHQFQIQPNVVLRLSNKIRVVTNYQFSIIKQLANEITSASKLTQQKIIHQTFIQLTKQNSFCIQYEHYFTNQQGIKANIPFLDTELNFNNKKGNITYKAEWKNILNSSQFITQQNGAFIRSSSSTQLQRSWLMLSINLRFN